MLSQVLSYSQSEQEDPFLELRKGWVVRRLGPNCSRVELTMLPKGRNEYKLLEAIGRETANVHLGSKRVVARVKPDLSNKPQDGLPAAAKAIFQATTEDWHQWCRQVSS